MNRPTVKASAVIVAFGSEDVVEAAVRSVPEDMEVVLVEQSADAASATAVASLDRPLTKVVFAGANRGFGAGCNLGAAQAQSDVIIFLNPDARALDDSLETLADEVRSSAGRAVCGPLIQSASGAGETRARRWTSPLQDFMCWALGFDRVPTHWTTEIQESDPVYVRGGEVGFVQGSCFAIDRSVFFSAGGFDERLFLYGEEESLAFALLRLGVAQRVVPAAVVIHEGQTSTSRLSNFSARQKFRSRVFVFRSRFGRVRGTLSALAFLAGVMAVWAAALLRAALSPSRGELSGWMFRDVVAGLVDGLLSRPVVAPQQSTASPWTTGTTSPSETETT